MAVTAKTEFDVAAPPSVVMEVLRDVESLPEWSGPHKEARIDTTHDDGTPDRVTIKINALGLNDDEVLDYTWTDNTCTWDLIESGTLAMQHGEYTVTEGEKGAHVVFELSIDLKIKLPGLIVKRGQKIAVDTARKGLTAEAERRAKL